MSKRRASKLVNAPRRKNGFTQPGAKPPKTMAESRTNNGFIRGK